MTRHILSNPQYFVKEAHKKNVRYNYIIEAIQCIGHQALSRMFKGKSSFSEFKIEASNLSSLYL